MPEADDPLEPLLPAFYDVHALTPDLRSRWADWLGRYTRRLARDGRAHDERKRSMNLSNPRFVLRNYQAQEAIELAEQGDLSRVHELQQILRRPYDDSARARCQRRQATRVGPPQARLLHAVLQL